MKHAARAWVLVVGLGVVACGSSASSASSSGPVTVVVPPPETASSARAATSSPAPRTAQSSAALPQFVGGAPVPEEEIRRAPWVRLTSDHRLLLDEVEIERTEPYESGPLRRVDGLFDALRRAREKFVERYGRDAFHGVVVIHVESAVLAVVVKCVFQTAAYAGYANVQFAVDPTAAASGAPAASSARVASPP